MGQDREIYIGPWVGEFGHWIMYVVPFINGICHLNPDATIITSAFRGDDIYLRDKSGNKIADIFIPLEWWPCNRGNADIHDILPEYPQKVLDSFRKHENHIDICNIPFPQYQKMVKEATTRLYYRFGLWYPNEVKDHVVVMPRGKNYQMDYYRSWPLERWEQLIYKLAERYKVYVGGIPQESLANLKHENVVDYTTIENRPEETMKILNTARACIADCCGGSQASVQVGCPTLVHGPDNIKIIYNTDNPNNKNWFQTNVEYIDWTDSRQLSVDKRLADAIDFIEGKSNEFRSKRDTLFILPNACG